MSVRLDDAQRNVAGLERSIRSAKKEYADWPEEALVAYLRPLVRELDKVRAAIEADLDLPRLREDADLVWFTLRGGRTGAGRAPAGVVGSVLEAVQKGTRQIAGFLEVGAAITSRLPTHLSDEAALDFVSFASGSAKIGLAPAFPQHRIDFDGGLADHAVTRLTAALGWAQREGTEAEVEEILPHPTLRRQILSRIREIAPSSRSAYESIEVSGYGVEGVIGKPRLVITTRAYDRSSQYLRSRDREDVSYSGQLVAIDIERDVFDLRHGQFRIHCHFSDELLGSAKRLLEDFVNVEGEGRFRIDSEMAFRVDVRSVRRLTPEEQVRA